MRMNARVVAMMGVLGFAGVFGVACSAAPKCSPSNCPAGCCDSSGACREGTSNGQCGGLGNTCQVCAAGQSCQFGSCFGSSTGGNGGSGGGNGGGAATGGGTGGSMGGGTGGLTGGGTGGGTTGGGTGGGSTGGGTGGGSTGGGAGGGGAAACTGCVLPNGSCVAVERTTVSSCGFGGAACRACATGELCINGVCVPPSATLRVGDPCSTNGQCQASLGSTAMCKQRTTSGNAAYSGGYCTLLCGTSAPMAMCPTGSTCVGLNPAYGEGDAICWDNCSGTDPCRTSGYACYPLNMRTACWISPLPPLDAGPPADKVGNACLSTSSCINPPETGGVCLTNEFSMTWSGGYCSRNNCIANPDCSADGGALCVSFGTAGAACVRRCADSRDAGQSTCRSSYRCLTYFAPRPDGGAPIPSVDGYCSP